MNLEYFKLQFEEINELSEPLRTRRLAELMSSMELIFKIPMQNNEAYNSNNKEVIALYKQISNARDL